MLYFRTFETSVAASIAAESDVERTGEIGTGIREQCTIVAAVAQLFAVACWLRLLSLHFRWFGSKAKINRTIETLFRTF